MTGQHGASQVVEAGRTRLAPVTLSTGLRVVAPVPGDRGTIASGAARTLRLVMLAHEREALGVVHQPGRVDQVGCRHDDGGSSREPVGCSRSCHHTRYSPAAPPTSTTPEPDKSHNGFKPRGDVLGRHGATSGRIAGRCGGAPGPVAGRPVARQGAGNPGSQPVLRCVRPACHQLRASGFRPGVAHVAAAGRPSLVGGVRRPDPRRNWRGGAERAVRAARGCERHHRHLQHDEPCMRLRHRPLDADAVPVRAGRRPGRRDPGGDDVRGGDRAPGGPGPVLPGVPGRVHRRARLRRAAR
jgi:hypothetical protein